MVEMNKIEDLKNQIESYEHSSNLNKRRIVIMKKINKIFKSKIKKYNKFDKKEKYVVNWDKHNAYNILESIFNVKEEDYDKLIDDRIKNVLELLKNDLDSKNIKASDLEYNLTISENNNIYFNIEVKEVTGYIKFSNEIGKYVKFKNYNKYYGSKYGKTSVYQLYDNNDEKDNDGDLRTVCAYCRNLGCSDDTLKVTEKDFIEIIKMTEKEYYDLTTKKKDR